jgi:hypothetical protein
MFAQVAGQVGAFIKSYYWLIGLILLAIALIGWYDVWCGEVGLCGGEVAGD